MPQPCLLILTGGSHTGKTSVAKAIVNLAPAPVAYLGVDDVLAGTLVRPPGDPWAEIPLAYELLIPQLDVLLAENWTVVLESTFTYVPDEGKPQLHLDRLERIVAAARHKGLPWLIAQLDSPDDVVRQRSDATGRLSPEIAGRTALLHREAALPEPTLRVDTGENDIYESVDLILAELGRLSTA